MWQTGDPYEVACSGCEPCDACSFEEPPLVPECKKALDHTSSPGGTVTLDQLRIDPGYWRATESTVNVLECFNADACLGGVTGTAGYCRKGSEGPCERGRASQWLYRLCTVHPGSLPGQVYWFLIQLPILWLQSLAFFETEMEFCLFTVGFCAHALNRTTG